MDDEFDMDQVDGGTLRRKLEETIAENQKLKRDLASREAEAAITELGLSLVKPEDLAVVDDLSNIRAHAEKLQAEREQARVEAIRSVYVERGLEGDALEAAVAAVVAGGTPDVVPADSDAVRAARAAGSVSGRPVQQVSTADLHAEAALAAYFGS